MDGSDFFGMLFGNDKFDDLVGELVVATSTRCGAIGLDCVLGVTTEQSAGVRQRGCSNVWGKRGGRRGVRLSLATLHGRRGVRLSHANLHGRANESTGQMDGPTTGRLD
eukprot:357718-Chlamydomonas_euryale.AAC.4